ncbi:hypothetical protein [Paenibacillus methanolicus]|uniref:Uncharacterized protein n=1 Tax=Paenibacillus methanolicus TaxID=582686 RepID=A0A5S5BKS7_9BACL|nr:hypothetical protein [Paenibacillus methanolicus]TYP67687.1 hypothetical protein BCM02_12312 [Paenibacillus methanolicus]
MPRLSSMPFYTGKLQLIAKFSNDLARLSFLQSGKVYMNRLGIYKEIEREQGKKGVGDKYDGHTVIRKILSGTLINQETGEETGKIEFTPSSEVSFAFNDVLAMPTFCSYAVDSNHLEIIGENEGYYLVELVFTPEELNQIVTDFGEHALFINYGKFVAELSKAAIDRGYELKGDKVKYADYSINQSDRLKDTDTINVAFWKSDEFSHQNEHRFVIPNIGVETPLILEICNLQEYSSIVSAKNLITEPIRFPVPKPPTD